MFTQRLVLSILIIAFALAIPAAAQDSPPLNLDQAVVRRVAIDAIRDASLRELESILTKDMLDAVLVEIRSRGIDPKTLLTPTGHAGGTCGNDSRLGGAFDAEGEIREFSYGGVTGGTDDERAFVSEPGLAAPAGPGTGGLGGIGGPGGFGAPFGDGGLAGGDFGFGGGDFGAPFDDAGGVNGGVPFEPDPATPGSLPDGTDPGFGPPAGPLGPPAASVSLRALGHFSPSPR